MEADQGIERQPGDTMKKLLPLIALSAMSGATLAQESPWSIAAYWDARTKTTNAVVLRQIGTIRRPFGASFNLQVEGFVGSDIESNLVGGFALTNDFKVAENVDFKFGLAISTQQDKPSGAGLILGLTVRF